MGTSWSNKKLGKSPVVVSTIFNVGTVEMIACLWIILVFSSVVLSQTNFYTHGRYGKRGELHTPEISPFFSGSRYGRDNSGNGDGSSFSSLTNVKSPKKSLEILPRTDRFFLGSRYGKRGLRSNESDDDERLRSSRNIQNLETVLNYINRARHANNQQLMAGNNENYEQKISDNIENPTSEEINAEYSMQKKFKSDSKWRWF